MCYLIVLASLLTCQLVQTNIYNQNQERSESIFREASKFWRYYHLQCNIAPGMKVNTFDMGATCHMILNCCNFAEFFIDQEVQRLYDNTKQNNICWFIIFAPLLLEMIIFFGYVVMVFPPCTGRTPPKDVDDDQEEIQKLRTKLTELEKRYLANKSHDIHEIKTSSDHLNTLIDEYFESKRDEMIRGDSKQTREEKKDMAGV